MTFKLGSYKTANSLLKAVLKLFTNERARWIKDDFEEEKTIKGKLTTCFCLAGAIQKGAATDAVKNEAFAKIVSVLPKKYRGPKKYRDPGEENIWNIAAYNDVQRRRVDDIIGTLELAVVK
jgi:hypothetical protein